MDVKKIAKVQVGFGILLLIASIIAGIILTNVLFYKTGSNFQNSYESLSAQNRDTTYDNKVSLDSQFNLLISSTQIYFTFWIVSLVGSILSGILSVMFILQGSVNLNRKK